MSKTYTKTSWVNGTTPYINAENLNKMEQGIDDAIEQANTNETAIGALGEDVTALENALTASSASFTISVSGATVTTWHNTVEKYGRVCILRLNFTCSVDANQRQTICTLPAGYRPGKEMFTNFVTNLSIAGGGNNNYVAIGTDGSVTLNPRTGVRLIVPFIAAEESNNG